MISIFRNGKHVQIVFITDLPNKDGGKTNFNFYYDCGETEYAELLAKKMQTMFADRIESIRKQEFLDGWRHAKAKKHGKSWFKYFFRSLSDRASNGFVR